MSRHNAPTDSCDGGSGIVSAGGSNNVFLHALSRESRVFVEFADNDNPMVFLNCIKVSFPTSDKVSIYSVTCATLSSVVDSKISQYFWTILSTSVRERFLN